jgi:transcriptional regulator with XRE-family HTH domain
LRTRRMLVGMTQKQLASLLKITFQQVQKYEKGINAIAPSRLYRTAMFLDVPVTYFFEGLELDRRAKTNATECPIEEFARTREGVALYQAYSSVKDFQLRRTLLQLIENLARISGGQKNHAPQS